MPLESVRRSENVFPSPDWAADFERMSGMPTEGFVMFRPARLALHEVIVRVTADIVVSEGHSEAEFGQNFRRIALTILAGYVIPHLSEIERMHDALRHRVAGRVRAILESALCFDPVPTSRNTLWQLFSRRSRRMRVPAKSLVDCEYSAIASFKNRGLAATDPLDRAVFKGLYRILSVILAMRGGLGADVGVLVELVTRHVCNKFGSCMVGDAIATIVEAAIANEGYRRVPVQAKPVLISLKGASAAGKSSIRPMLKRLMKDSGVEPDGYATISPDVWRRLLIDYETLGDAHKYAGHLTSREVMVIDAKLDRYIRNRANRMRAIPHLLVDRFRFDSFLSDAIGRSLRETYTRYVSTIHMYFVVTPPEETVERGWQRALERGRYKSVEDFLAHCVEAYSGMPKVLFRWLSCIDVDYRFYFLDNRVPKGVFPVPIAVGDRRRMDVYDLEGLVDIDRYQKINIYARSREEVYLPALSIESQNNVTFLRECVRRIPIVTLLDGPGGAPYLQLGGRDCRILNAQTLRKVLRRKEVADILIRVTPEGFLSAV